jgi:hypothetical protein
MSATKTTTVGFTFTARPLFSPAARQRIREQLVAMKAGADAFTAQMQRLTDTANMTTGAMRSLKTKIEGYKARITGRDRAPDPLLEQVPASPFGWIVDVVAANPRRGARSTLLIPRRAETVDAAIERLANSTTWSRGQLRYVATVLEKSREFDYWRIPKLMELVIRCHMAGSPLDPHAIVQMTRLSREKKPKPA